MTKRQLRLRQFLLQEIEILKENETNDEELLGVLSEAVRGLENFENTDKLMRFLLLEGKDCTVCAQGPQGDIKLMLSAPFLRCRNEAQGS